MVLKSGTRIWHESLRMATIVKFVSPHNGYRVKFDTPKQFEPDTVTVRAVQITPVHPATHAEWESLWPSFVRRDRASWCDSFPKDA